MYDTTRYMMLLLQRMDVDIDKIHAQTDRQTYISIGRQTDRHADRQTDIQQMTGK